MNPLLASECLPVDAGDAVLVGRVWLGDGPRVIALRDGAVADITGQAPTMSDLLDRPDALELASRHILLTLTVR